MQQIPRTSSLPLWCELCLLAGPCFKHSHPCWHFPQLASSHGTPWWTDVRIPCGNCLRCLALWDKCSKHSLNSALLWVKQPSQHPIWHSVQPSCACTCACRTWGVSQKDETSTRRLWTAINSVHEKTVITQLKLHSMCSTGTWDPQMHNSWCRLLKLFDLLSFSIIFIPVPIPADCKSHSAIHIYINIFLRMLKS